MLDKREIDIEIARLEYGESSYPAYAKLANLYTIRNQMERQDPPTPVYDARYSATAAEPEIVSWHGDSEFLLAVDGKDQRAVWEIMDDLMDTLRVVNPRVYDGVMRKIRSV